MNVFVKIFWGILLAIILHSNSYGYTLPPLNLGLTNILDGGPIRPNPGLYWQQFSYFYHTHTFLNFEGELLSIPSSAFNEWSVITQLIYQFSKKLFLDGTPGVTFSLPFTLYSKVDCNKLDLISAGPGIGNFGLGVYTQWDAVMHKNRPLFIHRLEFDFVIPSGKNKFPQATINPGVSFYYFGPQWSATLFATEQLPISWRLSYVISAKSPKTHIKAGDAVLLNYSIAYEWFHKFYAGWVSYFLQQVNNSKLNDIVIPHSKERVWGNGIGAVYFFSQDLIFCSYLYGESFVRNRPKGISFIARLVKHF